MAGPGEDFLFHEFEDNVYIRKCYGFENLGTTFADNHRGFVHCTTTADVSFNRPVSKAELEKAVKHAMVSVPHIRFCQYSLLNAFVFHP